MRWLRKTCIALGRWWLRQAAALVVIGFGVFLGWWIRKGTGPSLVSESFSRPKPSAPGPPRPGPLNPRDPAVAGFLAEFASLEAPSGTLLRLQSDLERGRITDFESLAKSLLSHPLEHFREEAMRAVLTAWGRKDPGGALRFISDYRGESAFSDLEGDGRMARIGQGIAVNWAQHDPAGALEVLKIGSGRWDHDIVGAVLSKGSLPDHLRSLKDHLGEATLASYLQRSSELIRSRPAAQRPSSAEWQGLAGETRNSQLAARYASEALVQKFSEARARTNHQPSAAEASAWLAECVPPALRGQVNWQRMPQDILYTLFPALTPQDLQALQSNWTWESLYGYDREALLDFLRVNGSTSAPAAGLRGLGRAAGGQAEAEWTAVLAVATEPAQRVELGLGLAASALARQGKGESLVSSMERLGALGSEGEPGLAALLAGLRGESLRQMPELFAQMSPEFQTERRIEIVAQVAGTSSVVAAELWLGASAEELAQPGAAAVASLIAASYLGRDSEAASAWIGRLPAGLGRDRAVARMIELTAERDPETCAQWAATIQDPAALGRATRMLNVLTKRRGAPSEQ